MGRKAVYLSAEDREYARRETKAQYWQRARQRYQARKESRTVDGRTKAGKAGQYESVDEYEASLDESNLTRNLRRKYLRLEAGLMAHTNNSLYDWAHELCRIAMQHLDDHDAGSKALIEASESPRKWWDKAKSIEGQVEEQVGEGTLLDYIRRRNGRFEYAVESVVNINFHLSFNTLEEERAYGRLYYSSHHADIL
ncbi:hypothetical protein BDZ89DRAFT_1042219 [Hymenopellis radicata]|nr:hypothetical protein BDZ89DRAFT_1051136 [Hymenopellis radicata]KAF9022412.1 hypothetical protein BDZ89DRAFT_1042219 [Hymenopellis radicata]